jgi:hypothetical protein
LWDCTTMPHNPNRLRRCCFALLRFTLNDVTYLRDRVLAAFNFGPPLPGFEYRAASRTCETALANSYWLSFHTVPQPKYGLQLRSPP